MSGMKATDFAQEILTPFDARHYPLPAPTADLCDAPTVTVCVNSSWWSHIEGQVSRLLFRDAWTGTDEEIERAILAIEEFLNVGKASTMGCGCGCSEQVILHRFNPTTGRLEQSTDGGVTWQDAPDPRYDGAVSPNPYSGTTDEIKCLSAANVAAIAKEQADKLIADGSLWASITAMIPALLAFISWLIAVASFGTLTPIALALTGALLHAGVTAFAAAMTGDVYNTFACIVYCNIQDDGTFTPADITNIKVEILNQLNSPPSIAAKFLADFVGLLGTVGMGNAAHSGRESEANCEDCDCGNACPEKYMIYDGGGGGLGTILEQTDNYIIARSHASGYLTLVAIDPFDCCWLDSFEVLEGTAVSTAHENCGAVPEPPWIGATAVGGCRSVMEFQSVGEIYDFTVKIYLSECPE